MVRGVFPDFSQLATQQEVLKRRRDIQEICKLFIKFTSILAIASGGICKGGLLVRRCLDASIQTTKVTSLLHFSFITLFLSGIIHEIEINFGLNHLISKCYSQWPRKSDIEDLVLGFYFNPQKLFVSKDILSSLPLWLVMMKNDWAN